MTRVLVLGGSGQLGNAVRLVLADSMAVVSPSSATLDLRDPSAIELAVHDIRPDLILNCAAYTRVDDAETDIAEASTLNTLAPAVLARAARRYGCRFVHVSTDYVFGSGESPFAASAATDPINRYGISKRDGEIAVLSENPRAIVVRTSWLHSGTGRNFVATVVRCLLGGKPMRVVCDQIGVPTRASHLAQAIVDLATIPEAHGIHQFSDAGVASWYDLAVCVADELRAALPSASIAAVIPIRSSEYPTPAKRPSNTVMDCFPTWSMLRKPPEHWAYGARASARELLSSRDR